MKIAFLFPGQGSQAVGMGRAFAQESPAATAVWRKADEALGFSLSRLCFEGPEADLALTANTQPAILTASVAAAAVLSERGISPDLCAGHSLGEYSALVVTGALGFVDAIRIVRKRGEFMQEAVPVGTGAMAALMGLDLAAAEQACAEAAQGEVVNVANINSPGQIVIAGHRAAVERAVQAAAALGGRKSVLLPVSAPFHSALMKPAADRLAAELEQVTPKPPRVPVARNVDGGLTTTGDDVKAVPRPPGGEPGALDRVPAHPGARRRHGVARGGAGPRAHGIAQAHHRRSARARRGGSRVTAQGRGSPCRGPRGVTESKALAGRIAIVTGGTRGIGLAIARALAEDGASVVVSGRDAARLDSALKEIEATGAVTLAIAADQSKREDCDRLLEATKERFGRIDVLVNNAGITRDQLLVRMKDDDWDTVMDTNLRGVFLMTRAAAKSMMRQKSGRIINITSTAGAMGNPGQVNYSAAKAGVIGLTKAAARELAHWNILVNAVAPGLIETDMTAAVPGEAKERLLQQVPLKRIGAAREVAEVVRFLAGDGAAYITGQTIHVNGGLYM
jgi:3-oxoacyl-(acyl-carrier-protein) reductase/malonyl CoA-acyl carrier protein transacylase